MNTRVLTISSISNGSSSKHSPQIRLVGIWLAKLGFEVGKKVIVEEHSGLLILKVLNP